MTYLRVPRGDRQMYSFGQLNPDARPYEPQVVDVGPGPTRRPAGMYRPQTVELGPPDALQAGSEGMMAGALAPDATPFQPQVASLGGLQGGLGVQLSPAGPSMPQVVPLSGMGEQLDPQAEPFRPQVVSLAGQLDTEASAYQPQYLRMAGNCGVRSPGLGEQLDPQASPYQPQYVQLAGYGQTPALAPMRRAAAPSGDPVLRRAVREVQAWINARAFGPGSGRTPLVVDGIWGRNTEWGFGLAGAVPALAATIRIGAIDGFQALMAMVARGASMKG